MEISLAVIGCVVLALFLGSVLQSVVGFGAGMFTIPIMLFLGLTLPQAIAISLVSVTAQNSIAAYRLRRDIQWPVLRRPVLIRLFTLPLGVALLSTSKLIDPDTIKQGVGVALLLILVVQAVWRPQPRERLHTAWMWIAFSLSGLMAGSIGMGGPPMVLWVMAHRWTARQSRAFLFMIFLAGFLPQAIFQWIFFRGEFLIAAAIGLMGIPVVLLGTEVGLRIGAGLQKHHLRQAAYSLLAIIALCAVAAPYFERTDIKKLTAPHAPSRQTEPMPTQ